MELIIVILLACGVFALCFAVLMLRGRGSEEPPRLHACGHGEDCRCHGKAPQTDDDAKPCAKCES